jgi:hypothetical protein
MQKLILDTLGMIDEHEELERVLEFYKDGLRGLLTNFLLIYLDKRPLEVGEDRDAAFFEEVLTQYQNSIQYRLASEDPMGNLADMTVTLTCYYVCNTAREMVELNEQELRKSIINPTSMHLGSGYVVVPLLA